MFLSVRSPLLAVALALLAPAGVGAVKVDLSPKSWPEGDLEYYTALHYNRNRAQPEVRTRKGLVVGSAGALAVRSGVEALRQGGTAADAALATTLAQITLDAGGITSFAGDLSLVYYEASTGEVYQLNGAWDVPRGQTSGADIPSCDTPDGRQILVPGLIAAVEAAHQRFGALRFKTIFGPAIYFAREGFEVSSGLAYRISYRAETITRYQAGRDIFLKPDGSLYEQGDWFRQPKLARTLRKISRKGSRHMYRGPWAGRFVEAVQAIGGRVARSDLADYEPLWLVPETVDWSGYRLHAPPRPAQGGPHLSAAMTDLDPTILSSSGHYTASADALSALLEAVVRRHQVPVGGSIEAGAHPGGHSESVLAIDEEGNVAAVMHTINALFWGRTGIFVDGISISDVGCWAQNWVTRAGPGGRLPTLDNPTIVTHDGLAVALSSAVGGGLFEATLFTMVNALAYGMGPQQAIATPRFHESSRYTTMGGTVVSATHRVLIGEFAPDLLLAVRNRGFRIEEVPRNSSYKGYCILATIDPASGIRLGATLPGFNGLAASE